MTWLLGLAIVLGLVVFTIGALTGALVTFHLIVTSLCAAMNTPKPDPSDPLDPEAIKAAWQGRVREP